MTVNVVAYARTKRQRFDAAGARGARVGARGPRGGATAGSDMTVTRGAYARKRPRAGEQRVVRSGPRGADGHVLARRADAVREHGDDDARVGIDPEARPREAEVPEGPRAERALPRSSPSWLLPSNPARSVPPGRSRDEPREARGRRLPFERVEHRAARTRAPRRRCRTSRRDPSRRPRQRPRVLVVHAPAHEPASPRDVLGRRGDALEVTPARASSRAVPSVARARAGARRAARSPRPRRARPLRRASATPGEHVAQVAVDRGEAPVGAAAPRASSRRASAASRSARGASTRSPRDAAARRSGRCASSPARCASSSSSGARALAVPRELGHESTRASARGSESRSTRRPPPSSASSRSRDRRTSRAPPPDSTRHAVADLHARRPRPRSARRPRRRTRAPLPAGSAAPAHFVSREAARLLKPRVSGSASRSDFDRSSLTRRYTLLGRRASSRTVDDTPMAEFAWEARARPARSARASMEAETENAVNQRLRSQQLSPTKVKKKAQELGSFQFGTGVSQKDIVTFTRLFATMIDAGLPIVQCLDILAEPDRQQDLRSVHPEGRQVERRAGRDLQRLAAPAPEGLRSALLQPRPGRRGRRHPRHDPEPPRRLHREGDEAAAPGQGRDGLPEHRPRRLHRRALGPARLRHPVVPEDVQGLRREGRAARRSRRWSSRRRRPSSAHLSL